FDCKSDQNIKTLIQKIIYILKIITVQILPRQNDFLNIKGQLADQTGYLNYILYQQKNERNQEYLQTIESGRIFKLINVSLENYVDSHRIFIEKDSQIILQEVHYKFKKLKFKINQKRDQQQIQEITNQDFSQIKIDYMTQKPFFNISQMKLQTQNRYTFYGKVTDFGEQDNYFIGNVTDPTGNIRFEVLKMIILPQLQMMRLLYSEIFKQNQIKKVKSKQFWIIIANMQLLI
ncbi:hypothetical protein IMG5_153410, partial [Ichthyophthirius multifiliis]